MPLIQMTPRDAKNAQTVLEALAECDPLLLDRGVVRAAQRLADRSAAVLGAGRTASTMWADHEPLEGL